MALAPQILTKASAAYFQWVLLWDTQRNQVGLGMRDSFRNLEIAASRLDGLPGFLDICIRWISRHCVATLLLLL